MTAARARKLKTKLKALPENTQKFPTMRGNTQVFDDCQILSLSKHKL